MKKLVLLAVALVCACTLKAQTRVDLRTQGSGIDFADAASTRPTKTGPALPGSCQTGQLFFLTIAPTGKNIYGCVGPNAWAVQAPGSELPDTTNNSGKILSTDGAGFLWSGIAGDASGAASTLTVTGLRGRTVSTTAPTEGQSLIWNTAGSEWRPGTITGGAGAVSSVAGRTGAVALETTDLRDCTVSRTSANVLTIGACKFAFPNRGKTSLVNITITTTGGMGTAFIFASHDGAIRVGRSGTLSITCTGCDDGGLMSSFPDDVARVAAWPATSIAGAWDPTGQTDERVLVNGALQLIAGTGVMIASGALGEKRITVDTAQVQTKTAAQAGQELVCAATGTATAQVCAMTPTLTAYTPGMHLRFRSGANSTGALTLNVDALGTVPVKLSGGIADPAANDVMSAKYYDLTYDGAVFQLPPSVIAGAGVVSTPSLSGAQLSIDTAIVQTKTAAQAGQELVCAATGTATAQVCAMTPTLTAYTPGMHLRFRSGANSTGALTLNVDALGAVPVKLSGGIADPAANGVMSGKYYDLTYDGAVFQLPPSVTAGAGVVSTPSLSGAQLSIDTAIVQTKTATQAGQELVCAATGTATAQVCAMTPTLTAYIDKQVLQYIPSSTNVTTQSVAADGLAARQILNHDGTALSAGALTALRQYPLTYKTSDTTFRLPPGGSATAASLSTYYECDEFIPAANASISINPHIIGRGWEMVQTTGSNSHTTLSGEDNHPGIARLTTPGGGADSTYIVWRRASAAHIYSNLMSRSWTAEFILRVNQTTTNVTAGFMFSSGGQRLQIYKLATGNWFAEKCNAVGTVCNTAGADTGVAASSTGWVHATFVSTGSSITVSINGSTPVTVTGTDPTGAASPYFQVTSTSAAIKSLDIDAHSMRLILGQRY